jgi:hypothetical protein
MDFIYLQKYQQLDWSLLGVVISILSQPITIFSGQICRWLRKEYNFSPFDSKSGWLLRLYYHICILSDIKLDMTARRSFFCLLRIYDIFLVFEYGNFFIFLVVLYWMVSFFLPPSSKSPPLALPNIPLCLILSPEYQL